MSNNTENYRRFRNVFVGFRVSPKEAIELNYAVKLSGLTKRDFCFKKCMNRDIVVQGNPKVYKALKDSLTEVLEELTRIQSSGEIYPELLSTINLISTTLNGMKNDFDYTKKNDCR